MTAGVIVASGVSGLLLFALLVGRRRERFGPAAGTLQAAALALAISLIAAALGLGVLVRTSSPAPPLFVLVGENVSRESPQRLREEFGRIAKGGDVRTAFFAETGGGAGGESDPGLPPAARAEARFSSLAAALAWAGIEGPGRGARQVVVVSQRGGDLPSPAGMTVTPVVIPAPARRSSVKRFVCPPLVFAGRPVIVRVSFLPPSGRYALRLLVDDSLRLELPDEEGAAQPEVRNMRFPLPARETLGYHRLQFVILDERGQALDRRYGSFTVRPLPRVRYFAAAPADSPLPGLLRSGGLPVTAASLEDLASGNPAAGADIVVLDDLPAARLPWPIVSRLYRAAFDGGGILFVGGRHSFTHGGYGDSAVERLLPVSMGIKNPDQEKHRTALVIILDTSGSMRCMPEGCPGDKERMFGPLREARGPRVRKIDLARQALLGLLPAMKAVDWFGILGVRTAPYWELEPGTLADRAAVEERVRRIDANGGGINLYSALLEASKRVSGLDAELKHIIALVDTDDIEEIRVSGVGTVEELVLGLAKERISVSFIGIGFADDRYVPLLNQLAASTGGFLYLSSDITQVPQFLVEDRENLARRQTIRRHQLTAFREDALPGVEATPPIEEQFITQAKSDARTLVWSELGYPVAALRRVERGAVAAFAADGGREMAPAWAGPSARDVWEGVLGALLPRDPAAERLFVARSGERVVAYYRGEAAAGTGGMKAALFGGGAAADVPFQEIFPGTWRADLGALAPGSYAVGLEGAPGRSTGAAIEVRPPEPSAEIKPPDYAALAAPPRRAVTAVDERILRLLLLLAAGLVIGYELARQK